MSSVPQEECDYKIVLGNSLLREDESIAQDIHEKNEYYPDVYSTFQYKFQPASIDSSTPGLVSVDESGITTVVRGALTKGSGGITFKGKITEHKDTECLLIFDGSTFRIERCEVAVTQLRHLRAPRIKPTTSKSVPSLAKSSKRTSTKKMTRNT